MTEKWLPVVGHEFTPENTYRHRGCRTCEAARTRARRKQNLKIV